MKKKWVLFASSMVLVLGACTNDDAGDGEENSHNGNESNVEAKESDEQIVVETSAGNVTEQELVDKLKDMYGDQVLQEIVLTTIMNNKAEELGVTDEEVNEEIDSIKELMGVESDEEFYNAMEMQGVSGEEELRERVQHHIVLQKLAGDEGEPDEDALRHEYERGEEVKARHILVEDQETADALYDRLMDDEDFAELAKTYSEDPGSREDGGNLGFFRRGTMTPPFEEAAFSLDTDEISEPVSSDFGFHIIQVTDRNEFEDDFEEVEDQLRNTLNQRMMQRMGQLQQEVIDEVEINVIDSRFEGLFDQ
ncbi:peptidylprolyl isomerase [Alteribacter keqinensis]|uniref:peptidylprolyl isomerase n=1 Tax=Alteribacter keqinensis TaxID=2483800 RepID=UPI00160614C5|nr:peptidylprolyl isomerase [Alteribacter keqinensis]